MKALKHSHNQMVHLRHQEVLILSNLYKNLIEKPVNEGEQLTQRIDYDKVEPENFIDGSIRGRAGDDNVLFMKDRQIVNPAYLRFIFGFSEMFERDSY
eukprot:TRINITY_DN8784_c0_g1_i1.p1 TRINITY_DN8784_c0_g1~~TRINITY_DN8784_c0_g1_i1.p1  ORF type:complete len:98 (+),score=17.17 TRINITY_DN8784_c0_g1_i1:225-518(+)